ncbi:hypothetical protein MRB53_041025 [Persea americana]|nr:hypothetical protein MRB53_041025 [Persea americana]
MTSPAPRVAWIGLGQMGRNMAGNIVRNGPKTFTPPFILHNRTTARAEELSAALPAGLTTVAKSVEDAATEADILFAIVSNDAACTSTVNSIIACPTGIKGKTFVCCSTISPETTTTLAAKVREAGGAFISMPVFGAVAMAEIAQLVCVPAGRKEDIDRIRPFLTGVIGRSVIDLSDRNLTDALKLKIIGNSFILNAATILADAHVLAEKCGLGDGAVFKRFRHAALPGCVAGIQRKDGER